MPRDGHKRLAVIRRSAQVFPIHFGNSRFCPARVDVFARLGAASPSDSREASLFRRRVIKMTSIPSSSTCKDDAILLQQNATPTESREAPCLQSNHSRGDS